MVSHTTDTPVSREMVKDEPVSKTNRNRRLTKSIMEKRRRVRENNSIDQLKDFMVEGLKLDKDTASKLEKAEILELTVIYCQKLEAARRLTLAPKNSHAEGKSTQSIQTNPILGWIYVVPSPQQGNDSSPGNRGPKITENVNKPSQNPKLAASSSSSSTGSLSADLWRPWLKDK